MYYLLICLPLTTMIVCPGRMVGKGFLSGIPLVSSKKDAFSPFKRSFPYKGKSLISNYA